MLYVSTWMIFRRRGRGWAITRDTRVLSRGCREISVNLVFVSLRGGRVLDDSFIYIYIYGIKR